MTCPVCGTPTVPGARFCFACGAALVAAPPLPPSSAAPPPAGPPDVATERRVVTVLFGDLSDFTSWAEDLDPERVGVVTDRVLASLAGIARDFGGHVDKLTGDGIMVVFGAPTAHEDDTERAVRAASRMQAVVRRLVQEESGGGRRLGLRVGLNTGEVIAGLQAALSYTVIGDAVNTAARLSDAAGVGAVYAGRDTALATMPVASWRELAPLRLKGKRAPVTAYELVGLRSPNQSRLGIGDEAPMLGRDAEFGLLVNRLLDAADSALPRAVMISGEAGVGKTRLAQELSRFAGEWPGARVLWGRCTPYGESRDLAAVADMVRTACGIVDSDDVDTARARVARTVARLEHPTYAGVVPAAMAEALRGLLGLENVDGPGPREAVTPGPQQGGDPVRRAVGALFTALATDDPLLLVLDDLHWATPLMLEGLLDVAAQTHGRVLLLAVGRPDMLDAVLPSGWWEAVAGSELLTLAPLGEVASDRLLRAYVGGAAAGLPEPVRALLLAKAQGNPFFLSELLHLLVDRGVLCKTGNGAGGWELDPKASDGLSEALLPAGVQAVLAARIDGLDGAAKGVLRDASVLGLSFTMAGLRAVGRASGHGQRDVVDRAVRTLVDRRLLEPEPDEPARLRFGHTLVRDVGYAGLAKAERARRHAAAAAHALRGDARSSESDLQAASHGEQAVRLAAEMSLPDADPAWQARRTAFTALTRLGQAALLREDHRSAESLLARALALAGATYGEPLPPDVVVPARLARAQALAVMHRLAEAEQEIAPALSGSDESLRAGGLVVLGEIRRRRGDVRGARRAFGSALAAASAAGADRLTGEALRQLGLLDYFDGRLGDAEEHFSQAHSLDVRMGDDRGAAWSLQHLAWSATTRGDYELAEDTLLAAGLLFQQSGDLGGLSWVAGTEGFVRLLQGRLREARELAGSVLPLGEATGQRWGVASLLVIDALAAAELGEIPVAAREAERARRMFAEVGDSWGQALALIAAGAAARGADEPGRAIGLLAEAVRLAGLAHPVVASLALVAGGYAHLDRGDLGAAEAAGQRARDLLAALDLEPQAAVGATVLIAQVLRRRGRLDEALAQLDAALAVGPAPALLFPRRQALSHRAGTLLDLGRTDEALAAAREAVEAHSEDVRSRVMSLRALGNALRASGDSEQARVAFREAVAVARSTGQRSEIAASERLLEL